MVTKKRWHGKWIYAPAWVDYLIQLMDWWDELVNSIARRFRFEHKWELLDRWCDCEQCTQRRIDAQWQVLLQRYVSKEEKK